MSELKQIAHTPGPYKVMDFKCGDGSLCPGVMSTRTGSAVCWASGRNDAEELGNVRRIADALNAMDRRAKEEP